MSCKKSGGWLYHYRTVSGQEVRLGLLNIKIHESDFLRDFIQHEFLATSDTYKFQTKFYLVDSSEGINRFMDILDRCEIKGKSREYPLYELTALRS